MSGKWANEHWWVTFPDLRQPTPSVKASNETLDFVVVIPIVLISWKNNLYSPEYCRDVVARAALWARHSFIKNTDVLDYRVAVKFWIDDRLEYLLRPFFDENHVDWDTDVFKVRMADLTNDNEPHGLGSHNLSWVDPQLDHYERIIILTTDVLTISHTHKIPFFETLVNQSEEVKTRPAYAIAGKQIAPLGQSIVDVDPGIMGGIFFGSQNTKDLAEFRSNLDACDMGDWLDFEANSLPTCNGLFCIFPSKFMRTHRPNELEFIRQALCHIGNDQVAVTYNAMKTGRPVVSFSHQLDTPVIQICGPGGASDKFKQDILDLLAAHNSNHQNYFTHGVPVFDISLPETTLLRAGIPEEDISQIRWI